MRKNIAAIVFLGCFMLLGFSVSEYSMNRITGVKYRLKGIVGSHKFKYGDLFGLCYLEDFKIKKVEHVDKPLNVDLLPRDLSLYIICDSYVFNQFEGESDYFSRVKDLHILKLKDPQWEVPPLDKKKKNVLIFEIVLRNLYNDMNLENIGSKTDFANLSNSIQSSPTTNILVKNDSSFNPLGQLQKSITWINQKISRAFYHKNLESHLEYILFDFDFLLPFKMWKAEMMMKYFNRIDRAVVLSKDKKFLFTELTVIPALKGSSNYPISHLDIQEQVNEINLLNEFFKSKGFDDVLFSIIPNPYDLVSTNEFGQNNQLKRILASRNLKAKMLDITPKLSINAKNNFFQSDTHWNSNGAKIWLLEINQYLNSLPQ
jgi:hypothetical protein